MKGKNKKKTAVEVGYLSVTEAADYLRVSDRLMRGLLIDPVKPLPHFRIGNAGRLIRIRKTDIDVWVENFRPTSEINIDEIVAELMM